MPPRGHLGLLGRLDPASASTHRVVFKFLGFPCCLFCPPPKGPKAGGNRKFFCGRLVRRPETDVFSFFAPRQKGQISWNRRNFCGRLARRPEMDFSFFLFSFFAPRQKGQIWGKRKNFLWEAGSAAGDGFAPDCFLSQPVVVNPAIWWMPQELPHSRP